MIRQHMYRSQKGTTLIEVLITMGLLSGFLVILTTIVAASVDIQSKNGSYAAITTDGRFLLARIDYDMRRASAITSPSNLGDIGSSLTLTINGNDYVYSVTDGKLTLAIDGNTSYLTTPDTTVSDLSFQKLGNDGAEESIRYSFTLSSDSAHRTESQTYTSSTGIRP